MMGCATTGWAGTSWPNHSVGSSVVSLATAGGGVVLRGSQFALGAPGPSDEGWITGIWPARAPLRETPRKGTRPPRAAPPALYLHPSSLDLPPESPILVRSADILPSSASLDQFVHGSDIPDAFTSTICFAGMGLPIPRAIAPTWRSAAPCYHLVTFTTFCCARGRRNWFSCRTGRPSCAIRRISEARRFAVQLRAYAFAAGTWRRDVGSDLVRPLLAGRHHAAYRPELAARASSSEDRGWVAAARMCVLSDLTAGPAGRVVAVSPPAWNSEKISIAFPGILRLSSSFRKHRSRPYRVVGASLLFASLTGSRRPAWNPPMMAERVGGDQRSGRKLR